MARATRTCTLAVLALACCCACAQAARRVLAEESPSAAWQRNTQVQCPKLAKQSCGWLSEAEEEATTNGTCLYCGTVWKGGIRSLPVGLSSGGASYYVKAGCLVGLGCKGKVTIMTVFRVVRRRLFQAGRPGSGRLCADFRDVHGHADPLRATGRRQRHAGESSQEGAGATREEVRAVLLLSLGRALHQQDRAVVLGHALLRHPQHLPSQG